MRKKTSYFKNPEKDQQTFRNWMQRLEQTNGYSYEQYTLKTSLGNTQVYGLNTTATHAETLVVFPGFRTTALIWDLDKGLLPLAKKCRIFLVETNGQPNLSEGYSPAVKSLDYGKWGAEVLEQLDIEQAYIAGASFGGLVCMKVALVVPQKIKAAFLLNPGCFRMVSLGLTNLFYNLLPMLHPTAQNIRKFLNKVVFCPPEHQLSAAAEALLIDYLQLALTRYKDKTEKPYYMGNQLNGIKVDTYLLVGDKDILIPPQKSIQNAKKHLGSYLKEVHLFEQVAHGIECYPPCMQYIERVIEEQFQ
jgi:pimeloyl-ACP methyl ester carboxylesterase